MVPLPATFPLKTAILNDWISASWPSVVAARLKSLNAAFAMFPSAIDTFAVPEGSFGNGSD